MQIALATGARYGDICIDLCAGRGGKTVPLLLAVVMPPVKQRGVEDEAVKEEFEGHVTAALVKTLNTYGDDLVPQRTGLGALLGPTFFAFEYPTQAGLPVLCEVTVVEDPSPDVNERLYAGEVRAPRPHTPPPALTCNFTTLRFP